MQMEKTKVLSLGILLVMTLFVLPSVMATTSWVAPTAGTNHSSNIAMHIHFVNVTDITDPTATYTKLYYNTSTTGWTEVAFTSFSQNGSDVTGTLAITAIPDNGKVALNMTLGNSTTNSTEGGVILQGLTIDDTNPTTTLFVDLAGNYQSYGRGLDYRCTTSDNIDTAPTSTLVVTHPTGAPTASTTLAANEATVKSFDDTAYAGDYLFTCTTTDYTGNIKTSTATVTVDSLGRARTTSTTGTSGTNNNWIIYAVIIGLVLYFATKKK